MKKILSIIMVIALMLTSFFTVASASSITTVATDKMISFNGCSSLTIPADKTDDAITLKVLIKGIPTEFGEYGPNGICIQVVTDGVQIQSGGTFTAPTSLFGNTADTAWTPATISKATSDFSAMAESIQNENHYLTLANLQAVDYTIFEFQVKRVNDVATATVSFGDSSALNDTFADMPYSLKLKGSDYVQNLTINFESKPEPTTYPNLAEETFDTESTVNGIAVNSDSKVWTVFQKNRIGAALAANTYGMQVVNNGKTYKFAGIEEVPVDGIWAIKLVAPKQQFAEGDAFAPTSIKAYWKENGNVVVSGELIQQQSNQ